MNSPHPIDPERFAALIDGRLNPAQAEQLRKELAFVDDETLAAYADAVAVAAELNESVTSSETRVVSIASARSRRRWIPIALSIAAAAALVFVVVKPRQSSPSANLTIYALAIPSAASSQTPPWGQIRGSAEDGSEKKRAVRAGVLLTEIAFNHVKHQGVDQQIRELVNLLERAPGGAGAAAEVTAWAASTSITADSVQLAQLSGFVQGVVDNRLSKIGAYLEAVRISATSANAEFLQNRSVVIPDISDATGLSDAERSDLARVSQLVRSQSIDFGAVREASEALIVRLTR